MKRFEYLTETIDPSEYNLTLYLNSYRQDWELISTIEQADGELLLIFKKEIE